MTTPQVGASSLATGGTAAGSARPPTKYSMVPSEWKLELPDMGSSDNVNFGGCRRIEDAYERINHLGQGTYGDVFKAKDRETGEIVAVKRIKMETDNKEGFPITALREIKILSKLASCDDKIKDELLRENIIKLREIVRSDGHDSNNNKGSVYMVFDYMDHDMAGLLDRAKSEKRSKVAPGKARSAEPPFAMGQVKRYMRQLFFGLGLLQTPKNNILHRDLKNANLLVSNEGELKIADFGLARGVLTSNQDEKKQKPGEDGVKETATTQKNLQMTNRVITLWYRPPELLMGADSYGKEVDMWSAGCIMAEILSGQPLFNGKDENQQMELICKVLGRPTEENMPGCTALKGYTAMVSEHSAMRSFPRQNKLTEKLAEMRIVDTHAVNLLTNLLSLDPTKRMGAADAARHEWFSAEPKMFDLKEMPRYETSHELSMKKKRQAEHAFGPAAVGGGGSQPQHHHQGGEQQHNYNPRGGQRRGGPPPGHGYGGSQGYGGGSQPGYGSQQGYGGGGGGNLSWQKEKR